MKKQAISVHTVLLSGMCLLSAAWPVPASTPADAALAAYFRDETARLAADTSRRLTAIRSEKDWQRALPGYREELLDMLGLNPLPGKTDLKPVVTGVLEQESFRVEKLHFQSRPGLYVTANLYLPKHGKPPFPTILYVCGHAQVVTNGVSYGNKTAYQHHGAWYARNGYACLIVDTLQLGEIQGIHHGTYREGLWWWNSRGYTPAGVEAWNNIRALDYLETRPEVDKTRFGVTGRSGGGAYSWVLAALDDRIRAAAPTAGITDLENYVVDGCIQRHCDCMFFVHTRRWDYPMLAAMSAPKALLFCNSDKDEIFPLEGVVRTHAAVRSVYQALRAPDKLGLLITEGPHKDTQDLQLPVFRWFNRHLKGEDAVIEMAATKFFTPAQLRVFDALPADQINTRVHETFVPAAAAPPVPDTRAAWDALRSAWMESLRDRVFAGWPEAAPMSVIRPAFAIQRDGLEFLAWDFASQPNVPLRLYALRAAGNISSRPAVLHVLDESSWSSWLAALRAGFAGELTAETAGLKSPPAPDTAGFEQWAGEVKSTGATLLFFAPRGIGLSAWSGDARAQIHLRRRFQLLGQTLDSMRVWDIRRAVQTVRSLPDMPPPLLRAEGPMAVNALYAALYESGIQGLDLTAPPASHQPDGPDYLNVLRVLDVPQAAALVAEQTPLTLRRVHAGDWSFPAAVVRKLGCSGNFTAAAAVSDSPAPPLRHAK